MSESRATRLARDVRHALYPNVVPVLVAMMVAVHTMDNFWPAALWGAVAAICAVHLPQRFLVRDPAPGVLGSLAGVRRTAGGRGDPAGRRRAPRGGGADLAMAATLAMTSLVNGSAQVAVWGGLVALAAVFNFQYRVLLAVALLVLVGWALVRIGEHSLPRVVMSAVVGPAAGLAVFLVAR